MLGMIITSLSRKRAAAADTNLGPAARVASAALAGLLLGMSAESADASTNLMAVNVTPTSFGILCGSSIAAPQITIYADALGATNLSGQLGLELFPLQTGDPAQAPGYARRQAQAALRKKMKGRGYLLARVSGCRPETAYYFQVTSARPGATPISYPSAGPLPGVITEKENSLVLDDQLLVLDVPGFDSYGRVVTLSNANANYCLAGIVGDGAGTNQVFFNVNDLFALAGGNWEIPGTQQFTADVLGLYGHPHSVAEFTLTFGAGLVTAGSTHDSMRTDFLTVSLGSAVLQTGGTTNFSVQLTSSAEVRDVSFALSLPPDVVGNLAWESLAPAFDPALATITPQGSDGWLLRLVARPGQPIAGSTPAGQLAFHATVRHSAFVPLVPQPTIAARTDASLVTNLFSQAGRAVIIGAEPLLEAGLQSGGARTLTLYGNPPATYALEYSTNLLDSSGWTTLPTGFSLTNLIFEVPGIDQSASLIFYRAVELSNP